jgi:hypothetical protein
MISEFVHRRRGLLQTLFRYVNAHDVDKGRRYDARSAAVNIWSHHWLHLGTKEESETIGTFYFHWAPTPMLYQIETDERSSAGWSGRLWAL